MCTPDELAKSLNRLASDVKLIIDLARKRRPKYAVSSLDRLHSKIRTSAKEISNNKNLTVCVIGNYSSGKSSFINKLIGENICPVGDIPITQSLTRFSQPSSEQKRIQVFKIVKRRKVKISLKEYQRECINENVEHEFHCLLPTFPFEGIDLYDTPGFESVGNEAGDNSTLSVAENCDMVLFILDINVGNPDGTVLKKISELNDKGKKCILVLNKADTMSPQNVADLVKKFGKSYTRQFKAIHAYSSHYGEKHSESDKRFHEQKNQELLTEINKFVNFRNEILRSKFTRRTDDIVAEVKKKLSEFRKDCVQRYGDENQCSLSIRRIESRKRRLENAKLRLENDRDSIVEKIKKKAYYYSRIEKPKSSSERCWNFESEFFETRAYIYLHNYFVKVLRGIVPKGEFEFLAKDLATKLSNQIKKRVNKRHRFTKDEEEDKFDNLRIGEDISKIVFRSNLFPLLRNRKLEFKKQTAKISEVDKLFSLIKKTKSNAKRLGYIPKEKKETAF